MIQLYIEYGSRLIDAESKFRRFKRIPADDLYDILEETVDYFNEFVVSNKVIQYTNASTIHIYR